LRKSGAQASFGPNLQDLYFLHDFALQYASLATDDDSDAPEVTEALGGPTCSVYRLRCNPDAELGRRYESSSGWAKPVKSMSIL
jgi:hypothetical protein